MASQGRTDPPSLQSELTVCDLENGHRIIEIVDFPLKKYEKVVISHSCVSLPEGKFPAF